MVNKKKIKLISWNINGIRAVIKKDFIKSFKQMDADIFAIQETKIQDEQLTDEMKNISDYEAFWSQATVKKGYSGVCTYTRIKPKSINYSIGIPEFDNEGRIVEMDFDDFIFFNVYFPNGQMSEDRLKYKLDFYRSFRFFADRAGLARSDCRKRLCGYLQIFLSGYRKIFVVDVSIQGKGTQYRVAYRLFFCYRRYYR
jgi:exodeoxyribonuclease-3